jgi:hypothetical protein
LNKLKWAPTALSTHLDCFCTSIPFLWGLIHVNPDKPQALFWVLFLLAYCYLSKHLVS